METTTGTSQLVYPPLSLRPVPLGAPLRTTKTGMNATRNPNQSCPLARQGWKVVAVNFLDVALDRGRGFADRLS
ncbi:MAG: hypothetical protein ABIJ86_02725 [Spirochaetota bacterium]